MPRPFPRVRLHPRARRATRDGACSVHQPLGSDQRVHCCTARLSVTEDQVFRFRFLEPVSRRTNVGRDRTSRRVLRDRLRRDTNARVETELWSLAFGRRTLSSVP
ncbi:hypothetical protein D8S78_18385 [Natrialba swarupiae]|nr:hypothetical protein [Natrialba swarupiae]